MAAAWWADHHDTLVSMEQGTLVPGPNGNRSSRMYDIHGASVYVPQLDGEPWSVGDALAMISAFAQLHLSLHLLPHTLKQAALLETVDLSRPLGEILRRVLDPYGLIVRRELWLDGHAVVEHRQVRSQHHGRPIRLRWAQLDQPLSDVLRIEHDAPVDAAQRWIAQASGWQMESTFDLVGGWDPALEGEADSAYDRTQSSDFAKYANVYRYWVLNEDGQFTASPYSRGEPFDLAAFFEDSRVRAQPLMFHACVTLDDAGEPRPAMVEISTDDGATWSQYPGEVEISTDRAAVYLNDSALPASFLAAAKSSTAKLRVTASLYSPQPMRVMRWRGNAFAGERPPRVLKVDHAFAFRRIAADSVNYSDVRAGTLASREVDQTQNLSQWLVARMDKAQWQPDAALEGRGRVELAGAWPWMHTGDHLIEAGGPMLSAKNRAQAIAQGGAVVTTLQLDFGVDGGGGPRTIAQVRF